MAKRFTDTDKWDDEWFMDLEPTMKLLWIYICDRCDCAGVWKVNFKKASFSIGAILDKQSALNAFEARIRVIAPEKWFVEKFIQFQYPKGLSDTSQIHKGVLKSLDNNHIDSKPFLSLIKGNALAMERIMDKDMVKDKDSSFSSSLKQEDGKKNLPEKDSQEKLKADNLINLWNMTAPGNGKLQHCRGLSGKDLQELLTTLSYREFQILKTWQEILKVVIWSDFLNGSKGSFVATLNWLCKHDNSLKVLNGQYSGASNEQKPTKKANSITTPDNPTGDPYRAQLNEIEKRGEIA